MVSFPDMLKARELNLEAEQRRERILPLRMTFPRPRSRAPGELPTAEESEEPDPFPNHDKIVCQGYTHIRF